MNNSLKLFQLPNNFKVAFYRIKGIKSVALNLVINGGFFYEKEKERSAFHLIEHLLGPSRTCPSRLAYVLKEEMLGIIRTGTTAGEYVSIGLGFPQENFSSILKFFNDGIFEPLFNPVDIEREKAIIIQEHRNKLDLPLAKYRLAIYQKLFGETHPYTLITDHSYLLKHIQALNRQTIVDIYHKYFVSKNMVMAIAGDLDSKKVEREINKNFIKVAIGNRQTYKTPSLKEQKNLVFLPDDQRQQIVFSFYFPFDGRLKLGRKGGIVSFLISLLLGRLRNSRLFLALREKEGLVYYIDSFNNIYLHRSFLGITGTCSPNNFLRVMKIISEEIKRFKTEGITLKEFNLAKKLLHYDHLDSFDNNFRISSWLTYELNYWQKIWLPKEYEILIDDLSLDEIKIWAGKILDFNKLTLGIIGPKEIAGDLEKDNSYFKN